MPINIGQLFDKCANKFASGSNTLRNPFWTAFVIFVALLLISSYVFRDVETFDESLWLLSLRLATGAAIFTLGLLFLHDRAIIQELSTEVKKGGVEDAVRTTPISESELIPVIIPEAV